MPVVLKDHRIAFFNVPKCASTSIKAAFYEIEHGRPFRREEHGTHIHALYKVKLPVTAEDYDLYADHWKFTVVRDPAKRILSAYSNRVVHHRDMEQMPRARLRALLRRVRLRPTLDQFILNLEKYRGFSWSIRNHTEPLTVYVGPDLGRLDAVFRTDEVPRLAAELSARTGREVVVPRLQTAGPKFTVDDLSPAAYERLMEITASEYDMLAGLYERPARRTFH